MRITNFELLWRRRGLRCGEVVNRVIGLFEPYSRALCALFMISCGDRRGASIDDVHLRLTSKHNGGVMVELQEYLG